MAELTKKEFFEWRKMLKEKNPETIIKYASYCRQECPVVKEKDKILHHCVYSTEEYSCEGVSFVGCTYFVVNPERRQMSIQQMQSKAVGNSVNKASIVVGINGTCISLDYKEDRKKTRTSNLEKRGNDLKKDVPTVANYRDSFEKRSSLKTNNVSPQAPQKTRFSARYQKFVESVNQKVDLVNKTGVALNSGQMVMINGRLVSRDMLDD